MEKERIPFGGIMLDLTHEQMVALANILCGVLCPNICPTFKLSDFKSNVVHIDAEKGKFKWSIPIKEINNGTE